MTDVRFCAIFVITKLFLRARYMKNTITEEILRLKKEQNAVIMSHYYVDGEVQAISDYVGDSFYLAKVAKTVDADTIVFCGVSFMGESAKILSPEKTVLMPDITADCPMAHMVDENKITELREKYPDLAVVCYINSMAKLKTLSDVCVTSSNALKIVKALPNKNIFFIPDKNLGRYVKEQIPEKNVILNDGYCPYHDKMTAEQVTALVKKYPNAKVLVHPECAEEVVKLADYVGSTLGIINYAKADDNKQYIICTEIGVEYQLKKDNPDKEFYFPNPNPVCIDMKKINLENIAKVLRTGENSVSVSDDLRENALKPLDKMLELGK